MNWFCIINGTQRGPMSPDELRTLLRDGTAKPEDYVWNESFGDQWRRVRDVPELAAAAVTATVAAAAMPAHPTPLSGVSGNRPSCARTLQQAWDRMVNLLFRHTSFTRWMGMAFCVWISIVGMHEPNLAGEFLLHQVQPDPTFIKSSIESCTTPDEMLSVYGEIWNQMAEKARDLLTPVVIEITLAIWLILLAITCWIRARGAFMVMHRWHHPDATIAQSWAAGQGLAQSLFRFRLVFSIIMGALTVLLGFALQLLVFAPLSHGAAFEGPLATRGFILVLGLSLVLTLWMTGTILVSHFVVPIMYWRRIGIVAAGRVVAEFCNERPGAMTLYFTMYIILLHVLLAVGILAACCTCCCVSYLCIIPFINGLLLLPVTIFLRGLGISFLRQWRPDLETGGR